MARIGRPGLSREKKAELWERWKSGQCASDIARSLERTKGAIHHVLAFKGGIVPVARRRGPVTLVLNDREEISRGTNGRPKILRLPKGSTPSSASFRSKSTDQRRLWSTLRHVWCWAEP